VDLRIGSPCRRGVPPYNGKGWKNNMNGNKNQYNFHMIPSEDSRIVVFAYGSNMLPARMPERAPNARSVITESAKPELAMASA
jgi:hypothetical protein